MKVFVSSTIYDLLDVRSIIEETLNSLGITAILSENDLSGFKVTQDQHSIGVCLANVESSDAFICILDRRYGPSLRTAGFDDVSATELEYRRALECEIPIHFFVRDRLESDYSLWKANERSSDLSYVWCKDIRVFEFLERHRKLESDTGRSNWITIFRHASDLSRMLKNRFDLDVTNKVILKALHQNAFPLITCEILATVHLDYIAYFKMFLKNIGNATAFDLRVNRSEDLIEVKPILAYQEKCEMTLNAKSGFPDMNDCRVTLSYNTAFGVRVQEEHDITFRQHLHSTSRPYSSRLIGRRFIRAPGPEVLIE